MRLLKVIGFVWVCYDFTIYIGLNTFPVNYSNYPELTTGYWGTVMIAGFIYGLSFVYFYEGFACMYDILLSIYIRR